jgi:uncharacterized protein (DUF433 family)
LFVVASESLDWRKHITIEPDKMGGKPCIRGLRFTVYDVLDYLSSGMSYEEFLDEFPNLTREDIVAALAFIRDQVDPITALDDPTGQCQ